MPDRKHDDGRPVFPELTRAQWEVLSAFTDQRCANLLQGADFIADLSPEARNFLKNADKDKIERLDANMAFFATSKAVWRFLWIGGGMLFAGVVGLGQIGQWISDHLAFKIK